MNTYVIKIVGHFNVSDAIVQLMKQYIQGHVQRISRSLSPII